MKYFLWIVAAIFLVKVQCNDILSWETEGLSDHVKESLNNRMQIIWNYERQKLFQELNEIIIDTIHNELTEDPKNQFKDLTKEEKLELTNLVDKNMIEKRE